MPKIVLLILGLSVCQAKADVSGSIKIQVARIEGGKVFAPYLEFKAQNKSCVLVLAKEKKPLKISKENCEKLLKQIEPDLVEPLGPSDFVNPHHKYYQVDVVVDGKKWGRAVQQTQTAQCTADGKCQAAENPAAWRLVQALESQIPK